MKKLLLAAAAFLATTTLSYSETPTAVPTVGPSRAPTTTFPSRAPTAAPTAAPTQEPSASAQPSRVPTNVPTTSAPSSEPTDAPSSAPTYETWKPMGLPTSEPTTVPSPEPSISKSPTSAPSPAPTTSLPTPAPSTVPTPAPSPGPTRADIALVINMIVGPNPDPTVAPTTVPTRIPTPGPTATPSAAPTPQPTPLPSPLPSSMPSGGPTDAPTKAPTNAPTTTPTSRPSYDTPAPTPVPSVPPTSHEPTYHTPAPTLVPSFLPTPSPTGPPSTAVPTYATPAPSGLPSNAPTAPPTATKPPSPAPSSHPSYRRPWGLPTTAPTSVPTAILPFGVAYCRDFARFGMEDYYAPVLANLTNATSASAWCDNYNYTAVVVTRANYYATDTIFRSEGDDVRSVADRVRRVVYDAAVATRRLRRRIKQRIRAKAGGSASRRLASSSSISGGGGGGYAYNATSAIQFVDAATTLNVSTFVVGTIGPTGVPTSAPSSAPTGLPTPAPTTLPSPAPTELPSAVPTFLPTPVPTPACPTWATSRDCGDDCLCCTAYNNNNNTNNNGTAQQQQQQKDGKKNCLACHAGYDCLDVDGDGDGECEWNATFAPGNNLCDWWLWAWYYGPPVPGRDTPNGHDYADDFTLDKDFYVIGGQNCSVDRVEIISTSAAGRTFDEDGDGEDDYHACNGLFAFGNDTRYASGSADHDHDREASVCYKDYRDPDYRGYCSYMVGPSACARCNPYSSNDLVVANTLSLSVASGQTVAELNADVDFKLALRTTIFYSSGLDAYAKLTAEPYTYVQDLEFVEQSSLRRRLLSSVDALYNIVVSASSVTVSASDFYDDVQATAEAAVSSGAFGTTLTTYLATYHIAANYTVNVTAIYAEVLQTVPPTYWSLTADNIVPPVILNRIGGAFSHHSSLPACGCADL